MTDKPLVISLCDKTGVAVEPWAKAGYECWIVDTQHSQGKGKLEGNIRRWGCDVRYFLPPLGRKIAFVSAFPPCTHLARSGGRWFKGKGLDLLADAIHLVAACARICEACQAPYYLENPIGTLSTYWRDPDYLFHPYEYAGYLDQPDEEAYPKRTCLWVGHGFRMPRKKPVFPSARNKMTYLRPGKDRGDIRSVTPRGFTQAVFLTNHKEESCPLT